MRAVPRHLLLVPRPDLTQPGLEVTELSLRAHDGERLRGVLARSTFAQDGVDVVLRLAPEGVELTPDWPLVEQGGADLVHVVPRGYRRRRLEDRVLDLLRLACAAASLPGIEASRIRIPERLGPPPSDELLIASRLMQDKIC
jgi:hypothetical protein